MKSVLFALLSILVLSSCAASKMAGLREGQTRAEVISAVGETGFSAAVLGGSPGDKSGGLPRSFFFR